MGVGHFEMGVRRSKAGATFGRAHGGYAPRTAAFQRSHSQAPLPPRALNAIVYTSYLHAVLDWRGMGVHSSVCFSAVLLYDTHLIMITGSKHHTLLAMRCAGERYFGCSGAARAEALRALHACAAARRAPQPESPGC